MENSRDFEEIALPFLDSVYRAALALCKRADQAEDLTQMTFLKAFERFDSFQRGTNCKAWLFQIMRNLWIDQLRHRKTVGQMVPMDEQLLPAASHEETTTWSDAHNLLENFSDEQVIRAMKRLPEEQRLTLYLTDVEQMSQQEVAEITGTAVGTVKSRTSRAREMLKNHLRTYAQEMGLAGQNR